LPESSRDGSTNEGREDSQNQTCDQVACDRLDVDEEKKVFAFERVNNCLWMVVDTVI